MISFFSRLPFDAPDEFPLFGVTYFIALFLVLLLLYLSYRYFPKLKMNKMEPIIRYLLIGYIISTIIYKQWFYVVSDVPWYAHIPEATCGFAVFTGIMTLITKNRTMFVITLFWGWGAFLALFAPNILEGPDHYYFYQFYLRHAAIILVALYMIRVFDYSIQKRDYIIYVSITLPLSLVGWGISSIIDDPDYLNMFYMMEPAVSNPILDAVYNVHPLLYTVFWIVVAIVFGFLYGLPFYTNEKE